MKKQKPYLVTDTTIQYNASPKSEVMIEHITYDEEAKIRQASRLLSYHYFMMSDNFSMVKEESGTYTASSKCLPGCIGTGDTPDEAFKKAQKAAEEWLETTTENGEDTPSIEDPEKYSGNFKFRMPKSLHRALAEFAEKEGMSLNQYLLYLITKNDAARSINRKRKEQEKRLTSYADCFVKSGSSLMVAEESAPYGVSSERLSGCIDTEDDPSEADDNAEKAAEEQPRTPVENKDGLPPIEEAKEYTGIFKFRMPKSLHQTLGKHAKEEGMSLNQYLLFLITKSDAARSTNRKRKEKENEE